MLKFLFDKMTFIRKLSFLQEWNALVRFFTSFSAYPTQYHIASSSCSVIKAMLKDLLSEHLSFLFYLQIKVPVCIRLCPKGSTTQITPLNQITSLHIVTYKCTDLENNILLKNICLTLASKGTQRLRSCQSTGRVTAPLFQMPLVPI